MKYLTAIALFCLILSSCSTSTKSTTRKGYLLSLQMAVQAIELTRVTHKDFGVRCHPREEFKTINCKFTIRNKKRMKQVESSKEVLQKSFEKGITELRDLPGSVKLTFEGI